MSTRHGTHGVTLADVVRRVDIGPAVSRLDIATALVIFGLGVVVGWGVL